MKLIATVLAATVAIAASVWAQSGGSSVAKDSRVFEMRTYYAAPGKLEDLQAGARVADVGVVGPDDEAGLGREASGDGGEVLGQKTIAGVVAPGFAEISRERLWHRWRLAADGRLEGPMTSQGLPQPSLHVGRAGG